MIVTTYRELGDYLKMFKRQNLDLLIIRSKAGYGKTTALRNMMRDDDYVYVNTHSTPLKTYLNLYEKVDCPVCFDDIASILSNSIFVSLLKSLSDTSVIKEINYNTTSRLMGSTPQSFTTTSNVCILLNEFDVQSKTLAPLIDRAFFIEFEPSREELLRKIKEIETNGLESQNIAENEKCVYDFIEENYLRIDKLSLRTYAKALQLYRNNPRQWKPQFMKMIGFNDKLIEYLKLKELNLTENEKIRKFKWSRATYFRIRSELEG